MFVHGWAVRIDFSSEGISDTGQIFHDILFKVSRSISYLSSHLVGHSICKAILGPETNIFITNSLFRSKDFSIFIFF